MPPEGFGERALIESRASVARESVVIAPVLGDDLPAPIAGYFDAIDRGDASAACGCFATDLEMWLPSAAETGPPVSVRGNAQLSTLLQARGVVPWSHTLRLCLRSTSSYIVEGHLRSTTTGDNLGTFVVDIGLDADGLIRTFRAFRRDGRVPAIADQASAPRRVAGRWLSGLGMPSSGHLPATVPPLMRVSPSRVSVPDGYEPVELPPLLPDMRFTTVAEHGAHAAGTGTALDWAAPKNKLRFALVVSVDVAGGLDRVLLLVSGRESNDAEEG